MTTEEFELLLFDRIEIIKTANQKYDLEHNAYISFSGGKDSTILHHLIDMALPNNHIPRVYCDTGIEYIDIKKFVQEMAKNDERIIMIKPSQPIKPMLNKYGYPFKSKQHAHNVGIYQHSGMGTTTRKYLKLESGNNKIVCPKQLMYQFTEQFDIPISDNCCRKMKKEPMHKWAKQNNKTIALTGMRRQESGQRLSIKGCVLTDKTGNVVKFHPLLVVNNEWLEMFINTFNIDICKLYKPPFNFNRTGCKGCPFALDLQEQLDIMQKLLPNEYKQCNIIWQPVYDEYKRIGYRLRKDK